MKREIARAVGDARAPLFWYYALTVVVPLANGVRMGEGLVMHLLTVTLVPLCLVAALAAARKLAPHLARQVGSRATDVCKRRRSRTCASEAIERGGY